ncbi:glycosyltransferase family 2 protein [Schaalia vaccimaxillae]|uniref:glycosyltransferase family 2 protein n=1 Tax=Schaalia vaccimaxillae TaxID=183916 RepID=UPI0003B37AA1|nr:glycosyltransferase family 2 protein [Schaalia vaccimaxillae]
MTDIQRWSASDPQGAGFVWATLLPAALWRRVTAGKVRLTVRGKGVITLMARTKGQSYEKAQLTDGTSLTIALTDDWYWLAGESSSSIDEVTWSIDEEITLSPVVAIIPTIGRVRETIVQVEGFMRSGQVDQVLVIDQAQVLDSNDDFASVMAQSADRVRLITQANFGGSGGYARGMIESLALPDHAVLLSDDDAFLPAESLRRMRVYQALAAQRSKRTIMGTPVLDVDEPTRLQICAEYVRDRDFFWTKADALTTPRSTLEDPAALVDALERHHQPNYTGWWGCLLPPGTVNEVGLPAPFFLKWDDAEYGLRAHRLGYDIEVLPGTGVWHPRWDTTSTLWSWTGVLTHRNRLASAAATGASRGVLASSLAHQAKHILSLQYAVAGSWASAAQQFGAGAGWLGKDLLAARANAQSIWNREHSRSVEHGAATQDRVAKAATRVSNWRAARSSNTIRAVASLFTPSRFIHDIRAVPAHTYAWWDSLGADRVIVEDGEHAHILARDTARAWRLLAASAGQHADLALRWNQLIDEYSRTLVHASTLEQWTHLLQIDQPAPHASAQRKENP